LGETEAVSVVQNGSDIDIEHVTERSIFRIQSNGCESLRVEALTAE